MTTPALKDTLKYNLPSYAFSVASCELQVGSCGLIKNCKQKAKLKLKNCKQKAQLNMETGFLPFPAVARFKLLYFSANV